MEKLSLRCERLSMKTETAKINNLGEDKSFVITQFKDNCLNCCIIGHKAAQCKSKQMRKDKNEII
jgi:hypothetical protein